MRDYRELPPYSESKITTWLYIVLHTILVLQLQACPDIEKRVCIDLLELYSFCLERLREGYLFYYLTVWFSPPTTDVWRD